jgi:transcription elongation factor GreA
LILSPTKGLFYYLLKKMTEQKVLTESGFKKIQKKVADLMKDRKRLVIELEEARKQGDLAENSAYHEIKNQLVLLETRVEELQDMIDNAKIIQGEAGCSDTVCVGSKVTVSYSGATKVLHIVGDGEADPLKGKISYGSPISQALINKKVGDQAQVETPGGMITYRIESIEE